MIAIIDYGMGNLRSVEKAFESLGAFCSVISAPSSLEEFKGVVLPGVGAFGEAMVNLERDGWPNRIREFTSAGRPLLGICLGAQLLFEFSEEGDQHQGLALFPGRVVRFPDSVRVPHMGWNQLRLIGKSSLLKGVGDGDFAYFVHSYYIEPGNPAVVAASTDYGVDFASAVGRGNIFGLQFHPEKSQAVGLQILRNFLEIINDKGR